MNPINIKRTMILNPLESKILKRNLIITPPPPNMSEITGKKIKNIIR